MTKTQWLLVGGEGHGTILWVKAGNSVRYPSMSGLADLSYEGRQYIYDDKVFQVGLHNPTEDECSEIPALIVKNKLSPIRPAK